MSDFLQPHGRNWRRKRQPTAVFLPGEYLGERSLAGHGPWGRRESNTIEATKHARTHACTIVHLLPCPSLSPGACSDSCPLSQGCHPTISPSVHFSKLQGGSTAPSISRKLDYWIKDLLNMVLITRARPSFPHSQSRCQEACTIFLSSSIRQQTE